MIPFKTTADEIIKLSEIVVAMRDAGIDREFIRAAHELATQDQGVFDLMQLWSTAESDDDRDETIADLQDVIDDVAERPNGVLAKPRIAFNSLEEVANQVAAHKQRLRELIERNGGVSAVARAAGIPQPSLSRMLNSSSMPRRATLYKIAEAIGADEQAIVGEWIR